MSLSAMEYFILIKWGDWNELEEEVLKKSNLNLIDGKELWITTTNKKNSCWIREGNDTSMNHGCQDGKGNMPHKIKRVSLEIGKLNPETISSAEFFIIAATKIKISFGYGAGNNKSMECENLCGQ